MSSPFSVVLSGGGCKAFWANGALQVLEDSLPQIDNWAGVSAGAAFALTRVAKRFDDSFARFLVLVEENQRNFYPERALQNRRPFPHNDIYREALGFALRDGGFARLREAAPVYILLSYVLPGHSFVSTSFGALKKFADRRRRGVLHGPAQLPAGIGTQVVCSREAMDVAQLMDWTLMSSTIPPITPIQRRAGRRYLDGGLIDNIPIRALPETAKAHGAKILCLVSHRIRVPERPVRLPSGAEVLYLAAREPLPVRVWDYTSPERVKAALELGQRDATALRNRVLDFAHEPSRTAT